MLLLLIPGFPVDERVRLKRTRNRSCSIHPRGWGRDRTFGCEASPPRESHTLHPYGHSFGVRPRGDRRMGDHPVFRYPVFRERCYRGEAGEPPRRWGWVCNQPRGPGQAEVRPAFERVRTTSGVGRRSASSARRPLWRPWMPRASEGPLTDSFSPTFAPLRGGTDRRGVWMLRIPGREASDFRSKVRNRNGALNSGSRRPLRLGSEAWSGLAPGPLHRNSKSGKTEIFLCAER
jgi:hypothetical protein